MHLNLALYPFQACRDGLQEKVVNGGFIIESINKAALLSIAKSFLCKYICLQSWFAEGLNKLKHNHIILFIMTQE